MYSTGAGYHGFSDSRVSVAVGGGARLGAGVRRDNASTGRSGCGVRDNASSTEGAL